MVVMCKQYVVPIAPSNCKRHAQTVILTKIDPISQAPFSYGFEAYDKVLIRFLYLTNIPIG